MTMRMITTFKCLGCGRRFSVTMMLQLTGSLAYYTVCSFSCLEEARVQRIVRTQSVAPHEQEEVRRMVRENIAGLRKEVMPA